MTALALSSACAVSLAVTPATADSAGEPGVRAANTLTLQNDQVRIGVDLARGGAITDFGAPGGGTLVNNYDYGRQIQASYYSGPVPYKKPEDPHWNDLGWNPIQTGDAHGNASTVLSASNVNGTIYVKSRPKQWPLRNEDCECVFEEWITIKGKTAHVKHRMTNARSDKTQYGARDQELPAIYTIGQLPKLVTYTGEAPFTGAPATDLAAGDNPIRFAATEHWAAFTGTNGVGVGVVSPDVMTFTGIYGAAGQPVGTGGTNDFQYGYLSPVTPEIIDHDILYDYSFDLVLGTVPEIRAHAKTMVGELRPDYRFDRGRRHVTYQNATDNGYPRGALNIDTAKADPQIWGREQHWRAETMPTLYVRAAYDGVTAPAATSQVFFRTTGSWTGENVVTFPVKADGQMHTYAVRLADSKNYTGVIRGLRLDPGNGGVAGSRVRVEYIGYRPSIPR